MGAKIVTGMITLSLSVVEEMLSKVGAKFVAISLKTEDDIMKHAADADAVIVGPTEPYTEKAIRAMTKCKVISRFGIGYSNINVEEATRQGIPVSIVSDASSHEVSDHALAFILTFSRRLYLLAPAVRAGAWRPGSKELINARGRMVRLNQQTLGLVGMGRIGGLVTEKARAFGLRVIVYDPYISAEAASKAGAQWVDFESVLKESDFISLHLPLTPKTRHLFGLEEFKKMKSTAYLINTSRGELINEPALYEAITQGTIAGAGLDVTDPEPPDPGNPLLRLEQVLVTGHSAWLSETATLELQQRTAEAVIQALQGIWPRGSINPEVRDQPNFRIRRDAGHA